MGSQSTSHLLKALCRALVLVQRSRLRKRRRETWTQPRRRPSAGSDTSPPSGTFPRSSGSVCVRGHGFRPATRSLIRGSRQRLTCKVVAAGGLCSERLHFPPPLTSVGQTRKETFPTLYSLLTVVVQQSALGPPRDTRGSPPRTSTTPDPTSPKRDLVDSIGPTPRGISGSIPESLEVGPVFSSPHQRTERRHSSHNLPWFCSGEGEPRRPVPDQHTVDNDGVFSPKVPTSLGTPLDH